MFRAKAHQVAQTFKLIGRYKYVKNPAGMADYHDSAATNTLQGARGIAPVSSFTWGLAPDTHGGGYYATFTLAV